MFQVLREYAETFRSLDGHADEGLKAIAASLQELDTTLSDIAIVLHRIQAVNEEGSDVGSRVVELERSRELWEANAEAHMLKGDALFKNARNAEERVRVAKRKDESSDNGIPEGSEEMLAAYRELGISLPDGEVPVGVPPLGSPAHPRKRRALNAKFR